MEAKEEAKEGKRCKRRRKKERMHLILWPENKNERPPEKSTIPSKPRNKDEEIEQEHWLSRKKEYGIKCYQYCHSIHTPRRFGTCVANGHPLQSCILSWSHSK